MEQSRRGVDIFSQPYSITLSPYEFVDKYRAHLDYMVREEIRNPQTAQIARLAQYFLPPQLIQATSPFIGVAKCSVVDLTDSKIPNGAPRTELFMPNESFYAGVPHNQIAPSFSKMDLEEIVCRANGYLFFTANNETVIVCWPLGKPTFHQREAQQLAQTLTARYHVDTVAFATVTPHTSDAEQPPQDNTAVFSQEGKMRYAQPIDCYFLPEGKLMQFRFVDLVIQKLNQIPAVTNTQYIRSYHDLMIGGAHTTPPSEPYL